MSSNAQDATKGRETRTRRALRAVKEFAEGAANTTNSSSFDDLAKKAIKAAGDVALPFQERCDFVESLFAIADAVSTARAAAESDAKKAISAACEAVQEADKALQVIGQALEEAKQTKKEESTKRLRVAIVSIFCAGAFVASLYFRAQYAAIASLGVFVAALLPELRAFFLEFSRKTE